MIATLECEARNLGFTYSADFLKIASSSLIAEAALTSDDALSDKTSLESLPLLQ